MVWLAGLVLACVFLFAALLESGVLTPRLRALVNQRLGEVSGLVVDVEAFYWRPWSGVSVVGLSVTAPGAEADSVRVPVISADRVEVGYQFGGLLRGRLRIQKLKFFRPKVDAATLAVVLSPGDQSRDDTVPVDPDEHGATGFGLLVKDLRVMDGLVRVPGGGEVAGLHFVGALDMRGDRRTLEILTGSARLRRGEIDEELVFTGGVAVDGGVLQTDGLHLEVAGGRISGLGSVDVTGKRSGKLHLTGVGIALDRVVGWFALEHPQLSGSVDIDLVTTGRMDSLLVVGRMRGKQENRPERKLDLTAQFTNGSAQVTALRLAVGESVVEAQGTVQPGTDLRVEGVATFRSMDPSEVLATPIERQTVLGGTVRFEGTGLTRTSFLGIAEVEIGPGVVFGLPVDAGSALFSASDGELTLRGARVVRGGTELNCVGSVDALDRLAFEVGGSLAGLSDFGEVFGGLPPDALRGEASVEVRLVGPLAEPALEGVLHFEDASLFGVHADTLDLGVESERLSENAEFRLRLSGSGLGYGGVTLDSGSADVLARAGSAEISMLGFSAGERGRIDLSGRVDWDPEGTVAGRFDRLDAVSADRARTWANDGPISFGHTPAGWSVTGVNLSSGPGRVRADLTVPGGGGVVMEANGTEIELGDVAPFLLLPEPLTGRLEFGVRMGNADGEADLEIDLDLQDGAYGADALEQLRGRVSMNAGRVEFHGVEIRAGFAEASVAGAARRIGEAESAPDGGWIHGGQWEMDSLRVEVELPDLDRLQEIIPRFPSPGGSGWARAVISGTSDSPRADIALRVEDGTFGGEAMPRLEAEGTLLDGVLSLGRARAEVGGGVVTATGSLPLHWRPLEGGPKLPPDGDLAIDATVDGASLGAWSVLLKELAGATGPTRGTATLRGTPSAPELRGAFVMNDGTAPVPELADPVKITRAEVEVTETGVEFRKMEFHDGRGGEGTAIGTVPLEGLRPQGYEFGVRLKDFHYRGHPGVTGTGSGSIRITPKRTRDDREIPFIEGHLDMSALNVSEELWMPDPAIMTAPEGVNVPAPEGEEDADLGFTRAMVLADVTFSGDRNLWLKSADGTVEGSGEVRLRATEDFVGLTGQLRSLRGKYLLFNTELDVDRAEIEFTDPADIEASYVDCVVHTTVLDEEVEIHISGTLGSPQIESTSDSGYTETEIYQLLALRIKRDQPKEEAAPVGGFTGALFQSWGASLANRFGRDILREVGIDVFEIDMGDVPEVGVGKYIGPGFFVRYTQQVSGSGEGLAEDVARERLETPERRLLLEYRLSEMFLLQGETGTIEGDGYLNVDLKAEWGY
jgi:hypothetical protein